MDSPRQVDFLVIQDGTSFEPWKRTHNVYVPFRTNTIFIDW